MAQKLTAFASGRYKLSGSSAGRAGGRPARLLAGGGRQVALASSSSPNSARPASVGRAIKVARVRTWPPDLDERRAKNQAEIGIRIRIYPIKRRLDELSGGSSTF